MNDAIAAPLSRDHEVEGAEKSRIRTLGNVRLRHLETNEVILIPTPSNDPNDPLNWPQWYKYYIASVVCFAMMICNFVAAGPSITIVSTAMDFFPESNPEVNPNFNPDIISHAISQTAYFFTTSALLQGVGNFFWVPLANKYGRRPVYVLSYVIYFVTTLWLCFDRSYSGFLAARILMGFGAGAAETIAPMTIADVFFLHERGAVMAMYTSFLSIGVGFGMVICGAITVKNDWPVIYQVAAALVGLVLLLAFFTFPETAYIRDSVALEGRPRSASPLEDKPSVTARDAEEGTDTVFVPQKESYLSSLKVFHRTLTTESLLKLFLRPFGLILLPPVLWAALVQAVTIGFLVAVSSNVDPAFESAYNFESWQVGLCFIAAIIGSLVAIPAGGHLGDMIADWFTTRNGGIRDPEMRLPAIFLSLITAPLSLVLYGVGIQHNLHWICPTIGLGLLNFSIVQGTNIALVYVIDAYRPVAGEITLAVMGFKSLFGFLLSFYTNGWVAQSGYQNAYGVMAAIAAVVLLCWIPLYIWGKAIRHVTWRWPVVAYIHWGEDREVGE